MFADTKVMHVMYMMSLLGVFWWRFLSLHFVALCGSEVEQGTWTAEIQQEQLASESRF